MGRGAKAVEHAHQRGVYSGWIQHDFRIPLQGKSEGFLGTGKILPSRQALPPQQMNLTEELAIVGFRRRRVERPQRLEEIPAPLAREITAQVSVPTIGIGAGVDCDARVLVMHDMLGLSESFLPRFAKPYAHLWQEASAAATSYIREVRERAFPTPEHSYDTKRA